MITPLDYRGFDPAHSASLTFHAHAGDGMTMSRATKGEHFYYNSDPSYLAPKTKRDFGCGFDCDFGYCDEEDGSLDVRIAVTLGHPSRRFSS